MQVVTTIGLDIAKSVFQVHGLDAGPLEFPMDLNDFDTRLQENIRTLLLKNELREGTPPFGIAIQVVRQGLRSLSWKQRFIYLEEMVPLLRRHGLTSGREWD